MTADPENTSNLTQEEIAALPERAQLYIRQLEDKIAELEYSYRSTKDGLRKANWANCSRRSWEQTRCTARKALFSKGVK